MLEKIIKVNYNPAIREANVCYSGKDYIAKRYKVAIYIRLSKEDVDKGYEESESIKNQKAMLIEHVKSLGKEYEIVDIYIDPGYTGTNFNRPDFQRMIKDIEVGRINMVITKDLSRLGRNYIETGEYIENWFPENNVRYVSLTDGIDTFFDNNSNNDIAPFKSILNDMYSKDLSKKIRTSLRSMQKEGKWVGGRTPLGYMPDPNNKNKLVINEGEAEIVKLIFDMALSGKTVGYIRHYLNDNNIPTVGQLRHNTMTYWSPKTIKNMLQNELYLGNLVQNRRSRISYKNRKLKENAKEDWIIVENTHPSLIDEKDFETLQNMVITQKYTRNEKKRITLLDGLLFCYECKHTLGVKYSNSRETLNIICNNYRKNSKLKLCTSHGFKYDKLEEKILELIRTLFLEINNKKLEDNIINNKTLIDYPRILETLRKEIVLINNNIDKMYMEKLSNKITEEMYERLYNKLKEDVRNKEIQYKELEINSKKCGNENNKELEKVIKEFLNLEKPTQELMRVIINRIEVHQDKQVDIKFNFKKLNYFCSNGVHF